MDFFFLSLIFFPPLCVKILNLASLLSSPSLENAEKSLVMLFIVYLTLLEEENNCVQFSAFTERTPPFPPPPHLQVIVVPVRRLLVCWQESFWSFWLSFRLCLFFVFLFLFPSPMARDDVSLYWWKEETLKSIDILIPSDSYSLIWLLISSILSALSLALGCFYLGFRLWCIKVFAHLNS